MMNAPFGPRARKKALAIALVALVSSTGALALSGAASAATFEGATPGWPTDPDWQKYVISPDSTDVKPVAVVSVSGNVTNAEALVDGGTGEATLTATPEVRESSSVELEFATVSTRYLRVDVTKLGLPAAGDPAGRYVQLAEVQAFGTEPTNLAHGAAVTTSESLEVAGWGKNFLTDGITNTDTGTAKGWTSSPHPSSDLGGSSVWATIDLGTVQSVSRVVLWPRTDTLSPDGKTASFPVDFTIRSSTTDMQAGSFAVQKTVTAQTNPPVPVVTGGASILLDYGYNVGGYPTFDVSEVSGTPTLQAGYSETRGQVSKTGDGVAPWASGDSKRFNTYKVSTTGRITNGEIQGGQRYQLLTLASPGTLSLSDVGIIYTPLLATADTYGGHFESSSDELNEYWYHGAYTNAINHVPVGTVGARWNTEQGVLDVPGTTGGAGLLKTGQNWTDYTLEFDTKIVANQAGWMVRSTGPLSGYLLILGASDNTQNGGGPNSLQQLAVDNGNYQNIGNVALSTPIAPNTWHTIKTIVSGTTVTTFIDGTQVASFDSANFPGNRPAHASGTVGFRQYSGEEAQYRNYSVTGPDGVLYEDTFAEASAIDDFNVPGDNTVPLLLDGAKRDRAVWSGDLAVQGPTLYYSTDTAEYMRGSLELLGSWAGSNGYVSGMMPPTTPINTQTIATPKSPYSANYSMYFVRALAEYYQYTGDEEFVEEQWPIVARQLAYNASLVGSHGLVVTNSGNGADWDYYDGPKTGEVTTYNALYYKVLLDGAELATVAGQPVLAQQYTDRAAALKTAINTRLFNTTTGLYNLSDGVTNVLAQDANVFAVLFGIAPEDKVAGILAAIKSDLWTEFGTLPFSGGGYQQTISPFISGFELNARFEAGDTENALQLLSNEWGPMIAPGDLYTGTFWENMNTEGKQATDQTNMAHGWSTMPTATLSKYVLGIQPVTAGFDTWLVKPHAGDLAWTKGQAPTPHGPIVVNWSHDVGTGFAMHVEAPAAASGTIAVPTFGDGVDVTVNDEVVWRNGAAVAGANEVTSATLDGDYIALGVTSGTFEISTGQSVEPTITPAEVTITGKAKVGATLTATSGSWGVADVTLTYRWYNNGKSINNGWKPTYKVTSADKGDRISVRVTASATGLTPVAVTSASVKIYAALTQKGGATIKGITKVGQTLTAVPGKWSPSSVSFSYSWSRNGVPIENATKRTYKLVTADRGSVVTVIIRVSKSGYFTETQSKTTPVIR